MKLTPKNWYMTSYTNGTWVPIVAEATTVIVSSLIMTNVSTSPVTVSVRLGNSSGKLATIIPSKTIEANGSSALDLRSFNVMAGQTIDVNVTAAGAEFLISGAASEV